MFGQIGTSLQIRKIMIFYNRNHYLRNDVMSYVYEIKLDLIYVLVLQYTLVYLI